MRTEPEIETVRGVRDVNGAHWRYVAGNRVRGEGCEKISAAKPVRDMISAARPARDSAPHERPA